jgi:antitoxin VapB
MLQITQIAIANLKLVYTFGIYRRKEERMATKPVIPAESADAKLFWNGRSQAVRLPKQFRFQGDRVRVTRMGAGVLIEPLLEATPESVEEWFARIDALRGDALFPEERNQPPAPVREYFK